MTSDNIDISPLPIYPDRWSRETGAGQTATVHPTTSSNQIFYISMSARMICICIRIFKIKKRERRLFLR